MIEFEPRPARAQPPIDSEPYDRWVLGDDGVKAEFRRVPQGFLLRFPDEADFRIDASTSRVVGWPVPGVAQDHFLSLFRNAVLPLIGDHNGGLFLHGSAVAIDGRAIAFIGQSGDGKTTLAGAFAKAGHPFLTEDVIELVPEGDGYLLLPKPSGLRLYADSAAYLLGADQAHDGDDRKRDVADALTLPFCSEPAPLAAIFALGSDHGAELAITALPAPAAVHRLLPHSFVLDVEDKPRLAAHFARIVALASQTPCHTLDYPREYNELSAVIAATLALVAKGEETK